MAERPTGTVTFLFTDVEGSTRLWEKHPAEMRAALERHAGIHAHAARELGLSRQALYRRMGKYGITG